MAFAPDVVADGPLVLGKPLTDVSPGILDTIGEALPSLLNISSDRPRDQL